MKKSLILVWYFPLLEDKNCDSIVYASQYDSNGNEGIEGIDIMNDKFFDLKSEKQDRMINAALKMFAINGYKHASTDDIVKEAGISKGLLFHYFTNKMGLYSFLLDYSAKYMSFEFSRTIGDEKDYFEYIEKLETAKLNVLRNYPYMSKFIDGCIAENRDDLDDTGKGALRAYNDTLVRYKSAAEAPDLKDGIDTEQLEKIIGYTVKGLTNEAMEKEDFRPEQLNRQIVEYLKVFKILTEK